MWETGIVLAGIGFGFMGAMIGISFVINAITGFLYCRTNCALAEDSPFEEEKPPYQPD